MPQMPFIVVGGAPALADALRASAVFPQVDHVAGTRELLAAITSPHMQSLQVSDVVFIFADTLHEDDPNLPLSEIVRRLTGAQYQAIVVATTPKGAELQQQNPKAGLLSLPLRLNEVLFAIGTFGYNLDPVETGYAEIALSAPASGAAAMTGTPASPFGGPGPAGQTPPAPVANTGWTAPPTEPPDAPSAPAAGSSWASPDTQSAPLTPPPAPQPQAPAPPAAAPTMAPSAGWAPAVAEPAAAIPFQPPAPTATQGAPATLAPPIFAPPTGAQSPFVAEPATAPPTPPVAPPSSFAPPPSSFAPPAQVAPQDPWATQPPAATGWQPQPMAGVSPRGGGPNPSYGASPRRGYVITIAVSKGGVGKSSMTLNLAAFLGMRLRAQGKTVCVIDANYQQADSGKYLDTYTPNINTVVNNPSLLTKDRILEALVHRPEYNLSVLLGPATPDEGNPLAISARLYNEILDLIKAHYDYVLIDTPVAEKFHEMFSDFALPRADYVVVPVAPNFTTLHNADNWLRAAVVAPRNLGGAGLDPNRVGIVLNRAEDGIGCSEEDVRQTMASWHFLGAIPETKEWKACNNRNELVAPRNYAELSQAFAEVLHAATGEPVLIENFNLTAGKQKGLGGKIKGMFRRSS